LNNYDQAHNIGNCIPKYNIEEISNRNLCSSGNTSTSHTLLWLQHKQPDMHEPRFKWVLPVVTDIAQGKLQKSKNLGKYSGSWNFTVLYNATDTTLTAHTQASLKLAQANQLLQEAASPFD